MKYVITGSLGNISNTIVKKLINAGHEVTVISSNNEKQQQIEKLGAKAAIGSLENKEFLKQAFKNADAVYLMIPPNFVTPDFPAYQKQIADNYLYALLDNDVKYIVQLSSIGADLRKGTGPIDGVAYLEEQLGKLKDVNIMMLRPSYFYNNFLALIPLVKNAGIMGSNFGNTNEKLVLTHPDDIAEEATNQLLNLGFKGHNSIYISSDEKNTNEIAAVLGKAINKPGLPWITFSDEDNLNGLLQSGVNQELSEAYNQMGKALREGILQKDYFKHNSSPKGKVKLEDFAKQFAEVYKQS